MIQSYSLEGYIPSVVPGQMFNRQSKIIIKSTLLKSMAHYIIHAHTKDNTTFTKAKSQNRSFLRALFTWSDSVSQRLVTEKSPF